MPLHFAAAHGSAVDSINGLVIYRPRIEPGSTADEVEYQYTIYKEDGTHSGVGLVGLNVMIEEAGETVRLLTLNLARPQAIKSMLRVNPRLGIDGDDFGFIRRLAEGFVRAFESRTDNTEAVRYMALTQDAPLREVGLVVPPDLPRLSSGQVVLAETRLEIHPIVRLVP